MNIVGVGAAFCMGCYPNIRNGTAIAAPAVWVSPPMVLSSVLLADTRVSGRIQEYPGYMYQFRYKRGIRRSTTTVLMIMQQRRSIPGRLGYGIKYVTLCLYSDGCTTHHAANYLSIFDTSSMSAAMKNMTDVLKKLNTFPSHRGQGGADLRFSPRPYTSQAISSRTWGQCVP